MNFEIGAKYIRADFHLHTKSDKEFIYTGEENDFVKKYVQKLKDEKIQLAVITNHNKFDFQQYKAIRKKAQKENICVLPGVELNVNEGQNGIHILIIFNTENWLAGGQDNINKFLIKTEPANNHDFAYNNGRSKHNFPETINLLEEYGNDFFIVLAHIDQKNGFFYETGSRKIDFIKNIPFQKYVIALQKVRTSNSNAIEQTFEQIPAIIEASDPKNIEQIGKGKKTFLKLSDFNFEAVKFALQYHENRVFKEIPKHKSAYIKSVEYIGGKLDGKKIYLNPSMNNLIGIRGSGKSSVLETIRYALDIELAENTQDNDYKNNLVDTVLQSGGKIILELTDRAGEIYTVEKTLNEREQISKGGTFIPSLRIESIVKQALYFGQKDLSSIGDKDSIKDFISRLVGKIIVKEQENSNEIAYKIQNEIALLEKIEKDLQKKENIEAKIAEFELKIKNFKKHGIDKKLEKETIFNKDERRIEHIEKTIREKIDLFINFINENKDFESIKNYKSTENQDLLNEIYSEIAEIEKIFTEFETNLQKFEDLYKNIQNIKKTFTNKKEDLLEEFSIIKRNLALPSNIKADDYQKYKSSLENYKLQLVEINKKEIQKHNIKSSINQLLKDLKGSWETEFSLVKSKISKINTYQKNIKITPIFKGDKEHFVTFIQDIVRGSGLRTQKIVQLSNEYNDLIDLYFDLNNGKKDFDWFEEQLYENLSDFLTYRIEDTFEIEYNGKPLKNHSLGQRASALIVFLLSLQENDIIIIDQPEDDLDSQTIYKEVITLLKNIKQSSQFIFATHNPNIPVLGDCEQILTCRYDNVNEKINIEARGIDNKSTQQNIINIMEGGQTAFDERKNKYTQWKS